MPGVINRILMQMRATHCCCFRRSPSTFHFGARGPALIDPSLVEGQTQKCAKCHSTDRLAAGLALLIADEGIANALFNQRPPAADQRERKQATGGTKRF